MSRVRAWLVRLAGGPELEALRRAYGVKTEEVRQLYILKIRLQEELWQVRQLLDQGQAYEDPSLACPQDRGDADRNTR